jgi:hypothetical protein
MKAIKSLFSGMTLGFAALVTAGPPATPPQDLLPFNLTLPLSKPTRKISTMAKSLLISLADGTLNDTVSAFGYDPSKDYHGQATIEVWTGGSHRQPVNAGNVGGTDLYKKVATALDRTCYSKYGKYCDNHNWQTFDTPYLQTPPAGIVQSVTYCKCESAAIPIFDTDQSSPNCRR